MIEYQKKMRLRNRLYSKPVLVILAIILVIFLNSTWKVHRKMKESENNLVSLKEKLASLDQRQSELSLGIDALNTPKGMKKEIVEKFSVAENGENMVIIVDDEKKEVVENMKPEGYFSKFWSGLKKIF